MSLIIYTNGNIKLDGRDTGLGIKQTRTGTLVFSVTENMALELPHHRYSTVSNGPTPNGVPGLEQLEKDLRLALLKVST